MGTWICHIRVAEELYKQIPGLDEESFMIGSLSPDSGYPNEDWTKFDPPKEVTHFMEKNEIGANIRDFWFYKKWLLNLPQEDVEAYSFRLGYFFHLICDNLWIKLIAHTTLSVHAKMLAQNGFQPMIGLIKADWYGLDHIYVRDHPQSAFWRVFMPAKNPPSYLDFIPLPALHQQLNYIRGYYSTPDPERILDRPFPYLNEPTMARFIHDCTDITTDIYHALQTNPAPDVVESSLELIEPQRYASYNPPLGDTMR